MKVFILLIALALFDIINTQSLRGKRGRSLIMNAKGTSESSSIDANNNDNNSTNMMKKVPLMKDLVLADNNSTFTTEKWVHVDANEVLNDPSLMSLYYYASDYVVGLAYQASLLPADYNQTNPLKISKQNSTNGVNYMIDYNLYNTDTSYVNVSFLVNYQEKANSREILNFTIISKYLSEALVISDVMTTWDNDTDRYIIDVIPTGNLDWSNYQPSDPLHYDYSLTEFLALTGYALIPADEVQNDTELSNYTAYGVQQVIQYGINNGYLSNQTEYKMSKIDSVYSLESEDGLATWYRVEVELDNGIGGTAVAYFEIFYDISSNDYVVPTQGFRKIQNTK